MTGWPADWERRLDGADCEMCAQGRVEDTGSGIRFFDGGYADIYLQRASVQRGYAVAIWRGPHVAEPTALTSDEATGYWLEVLTAGRAIEQHFRPVKMNYQILGNVIPHLHTHIVPRYADDAAPGAPLPFPSGTVPHRSEEELRADVTALRSLTGA